MTKAKRYLRTTVQLNKVREPGRYAVDDCLFLIVDQARRDRQAKRWLLRTVVQGRRRDFGLGGYPLVSLAAAREKAEHYRRVARDGGDPTKARKKSEPCPTVEDIALQVYNGNKAKWREGGKHRDQWINSLSHHVFPLIGSMEIKDVTTKDLIDVFEPIWTTKDETARRLKQRLEKIFRRAKALGHLDRDLPTEGLVEALPTQERKKRHHPAIPYEQVGSFIAALRMTPSSLVVKLAFEFLILTATRTNDVLGMRYDEIDGNVWTIPAERHKTKEKFRVPLTAVTLAILDRARSLHPGQPFVFPGRSPSQPLSNMAFLMVLERMGLRDEFVPHGFRSAFKDWASEHTPFANEVTEMALSHRIKNKAEAAYRRMDLLEKRRPLMEAWASFATGIPMTTDGSEAALA